MLTLSVYRLLEAVDDEGNIQYSGERSMADLTPNDAILWQILLPEGAELAGDVTICGKAVTALIDCGDLMLYRFDRDHHTCFRYLNRQKCLPRLYRSDTDCHP